jgi:hypothetical protein
MRPNCLAVVGFCALMATVGCHKRSASGSPPPPPSTIPTVTSPPPIIASAPTPALVPDRAERIPPPGPGLPPPPSLDPANRAFVDHKYDEAAREYEAYLKASPPGPHGDEALFRLALIFVLRPGTADWSHATALLKRLGDDYPNSPLKGPAELILSLRTEAEKAKDIAGQRDQKIKQLTTELERLKTIDADRGKRP